MNDAPRKGLMQAPHSIEAEQAVLGGLMLDRHAFVVIDGLLSPADFYDPRHQIIFDAIQRLDASKKPTDPVTLTEGLSEGDREAIGGMAYLGSLTRDTPGSANVAAYAQAIKTRALRRQMIELGRQLAALGYMGFERDELDDMQGRILNLTLERAGQGPVQMITAVSEYIDTITARGARGNHLVGPSSGFDAIDRLTLGLEPGSLLVIGARPSMGKTSLLMGIAERRSVIGSDAGLVFSAEMSLEQIMDRAFANLMPAPLTAIRSGQLSDLQWDSITKVSKQLHGKHLYIDETAGIQVGEIRARARRLKHKLDIEGKKLAYVGVDYLQLIEAHGKDANERITIVSKSLKGLAKELNTCVIALSQLNREVEKRDSKRPFLSDLRESGSMEQDADIVAFLWADDLKKQWRNYSVAKNRNGPLGDAMLAWEAETVRFDDVDHQQAIDFAFQEEQQKKKPAARKRAVSPEESGRDKRLPKD